jgi:SNF2 family DNA or RNA helicase
LSDKSTNQLAPDNLGNDSNIFGAIIAEYLDEAEKNFGLQKRAQWKDTNVMGALDDARMSNAFGKALAEIKPDIIGQTEHSEVIGLACHIVAMRRLIEAGGDVHFPETSVTLSNDLDAKFPGYHVEENLRHGYHLEDWHRAFALLRLIKTQKTGVRSSTTKSNTPAVQPRWLRDLKAKQQEQISMQAMDMPTTDEELEILPEEDQMTLDQVEESMEILGEYLNRCKTHTGEGRISRPPIADSDRKAVLRYLSGKLAILFDAATSIDSVSDDRAVAMTSFMEGKEADEAAEKDRMLKFWRLQERYSTLSAKSPGFIEGCKTLGIDPDQRNLVRDSRLQLTPWQVTGVCWMYGMEKSELKGGLVCDDCGVGKTILALGYIYHSNKRLIKRNEKGRSDPQHSSWLREKE